MRNILLSALTLSTFLLFLTFPSCPLLCPYNLFPFSPLFFIPESSSRTYSLSTKNFSFHHSVLYIYFLPSFFTNYFISTHPNFLLSLSTSFFLPFSSINIKNSLKTFGSESNLNPSESFRPNIFPLPRRINFKLKQCFSSTKLFF